MVIPLTPDAFYESAREFARTALEAHHTRSFRRVALDAGTAIEHLAKACLTTRSPALLADLRGEVNFASLLQLLGIRDGSTPRQTPPQLRTVGLRGALDRTKRFVTSTASDNDLGTLIDMRDGTVHAAQDDEVEERLVVAFVQHADALLGDLDKDRAAFWGPQLAVVDTLLADARDRLAHRVQVKLAQARANFEGKYGQVPPEKLHLVRSLADAYGPIDCPACGSPAVLSGHHHVEWDYSRANEDVYPVGTVWFIANEFECRVCGLHLDSTAEIEAADIESHSEIGDANPNDYGWADEDEAYEAWRERRRD